MTEVGPVRFERLQAADGGGSGVPQFLRLDVRRPGDLLVEVGYVPHRLGGDDDAAVIGFDDD